MADLRQERAVQAAEQALISAVFRNGGRVPSAAELNPLFRKLWQVGYEAGVDDEQHGRNRKAEPNLGAPLSDRAPSRDDVHLIRAVLMNISPDSMFVHSEEIQVTFNTPEENALSSEESNGRRLELQSGTAPIQGSGQRPVHQLGNGSSAIGQVHSESGNEASSSDAGPG